MVFLTLLLCLLIPSYADSQTTIARQTGLFKGCIILLVVETKEREKEKEREREGEKKGMQVSISHSLAA